MDDVFSQAGAPRWGAFIYSERLVAIIALLLVLYGACTKAAAAAAPATRQALPTCGVIVDASLKDSPAASLFEAAMLQDTRFIPVERTEIDKVVNEQELTALFSADALSRRREMGNLVKADLLVIIRRGDLRTDQPGDQIVVPGQAPAMRPNNWIDFIVFETHHGLRLEVASQDITANAQSDCDALMKDFAVGLARYQRGAKVVFAVLPIANQNIGHELDPIEATLPTLLEAELLKDPGVLVVALPEARALAEEAAVANADGAGHRLPFFISGNFDTTGVGPTARLDLHLALRRNRKNLDLFAREGLAVNDLPAALADAARQFNAAATAAPAGLSHQPTTRPEGAIEAAELAEEAENFAGEGDWAQVVTIGQAALLLDPSLMRMHGLVYAAMCHIAFYDYGRLIGEAPDPPRIATALKFFTDSLPHLEIYMEHTPIDRGYEHDNDARLMLYWRVIRNHLAESSAPSQAWIDADAAARATLWRVLQYKSDHHVVDCAAEVCCKYLEPVELLRPIAVDQKDRIYRADLDFRFELLKQFAYRPDVDELCKGLLWITGDVTDQQWADVRAKIASLNNPAILAEEDTLHAQGIELTKQQQRQAEERIQQAKIDAEPPPDLADPDISFAPLTFTATDKTGVRRAVRNVIGCMPAGPKTDLVWTDSRIYTMSADQPGVLENPIGPTAPLPAGTPGVDPANPFAQTLTSKGACFDGRLDWFIVQLDQVSTQLINGDYYVVKDPVGSVLYAVDVPGHHLYVLTRLMGLPPAANAIVPLAPGKVCVSGWFRRTWAAVASVDLAATNPAMTFQVIYEARKLEPMAFDPDPDPNIAYQILYMTRLPTSEAIPSTRPGSAPAKQPALPLVLARRGPGFLLFDFNTHSLSPLPDPLVDRKSGSSATLVAGDRIFWQGFTGEGHGALCHSMIQHLMPTDPPTPLSPGPLLWQWNMLNHIDPTKHEWSASPDGIAPFKPLRAWVPDTSTAPGELMESNVYGVILFDSGAKHLAYQVNLRHAPKN